MPTAPYICGITVNQNTSHFVELLLRTLFLHNDLTDVRFDMIVLDNQSNDAHFNELQAYIIKQNVNIIQTGFDTMIAFEKHGIALANFIHEHPEYTHFLFLDADIWFIEPNTILAMLAELDQAPTSVFANQARIFGYYAGRIIEGRDGIAGMSDYEKPPSSLTLWGRTYTHIPMPRCSPVCSLIANTPAFRQVVKTVGLTPAYCFGINEAFFYDTFGLMTHIMATHGQNFIVSSKTINHFTETTYMPQYRAVKDRDCLQMLEDLRAVQGIDQGNFYTSDLVS